MRNGEHQTELDILIQLVIYLGTTDHKIIIFRRICQYSKQSVPAEITNIITEYHEGHISTHVLHLLLQHSFFTSYRHTQDHKNFSGGIIHLHDQNIGFLHSYTHLLGQILDCLT